MTGQRSGEEVGTVAFPTPHTIQRLPWAGVGQDEHGNDVDAYGEPLEVLVHGWAPPSADTEPAESGRNAVVRDLDVYMPTSGGFGPHDRAIVADETFEVVGHVEDYTTGPFGWPDAGWRLNLKRVEG